MGRGVGQGGCCKLCNRVRFSRAFVIWTVATADSVGLLLFVVRCSVRVAVGFGFYPAVVGLAAVAGSAGLSRARLPTDVLGASGRCLVGLSDADDNVGVGGCCYLFSAL